MLNSDIAFHVQIEQDFGALFRGKENKFNEKWDKFADIIIAY